MSKNRTMFVEPSRELPVAGAYDVLVCGGGTSGIPAALAAAREGASVGLIERFGYLGGVPASNTMPCWHGLREHHAGLLDELAARVARFGYGPNPLENNHIEPELLKMAVLGMVCDAGIDLHLHTLVCDTIVEKTTVAGVITESASGRRAFLAGVTVDASGDGVVAYKAGAREMKGDEYGRVQGMTVRVRIGYIDFSRYFDWVQANPRYYQASPEHIAWCRERALAGKDFFLAANLADLYRSHPEYPRLPLASYFNCSSIRPGELSCNATRVESLDGTREEDLTRAETECRFQALELHRFLVNCIPGFENSRLVEVAPSVGVRESRRIEGDYIVSESDCRRGTTFSDAISIEGVAFDLHNPGQYTCEVIPHTVTIPYRSLLPKGLENIMVVGRAMSSDHVANSSTRAMYKVFRVGEVAGMAAAIAAGSGLTPRQLPLEDLGRAMEKHGIRVECKGG